MSMTASSNLVSPSMKINIERYMIITSTAALINLLCILLISKVYNYIALLITELELNRTQKEFEHSLGIKLFILNFINVYSSLFYIAFIKGNRFIIDGYPGNCTTLFGFHLEECILGGCQLDVFLHFAIIFIGRQAFMGISDYLIPYLRQIWNKKKREQGNKDKISDNFKHQWFDDFKLMEWGKEKLAFEYLEMVMQFSFVTMFVSSFQLSPIISLMYSAFKLRLDARRLLVNYRKPTAQSGKDFGVWFPILKYLSYVIVITNAFIIGFTSNFIPKMVYKFKYSQDMNLQGYLNFTLSYFNPKDKAENKEHDMDGDEDSEMMVAPTNILHPLYCRYYDFRYPPWVDGEGNAYKPTDVYWNILIARLVFVILFIIVVVILVSFIKCVFCYSDSKQKLNIDREDYIMNNIIIPVDEYPNNLSRNEEKTVCFSKASCKLNKAMEGKVNRIVKSHHSIPTVDAASKKDAKKDEIDDYCDNILSACCVFCE